MVMKMTNKIKEKKDIVKELNNLRKKGISAFLFYPDVGTASTIVDDLGRFKLIEHAKAEIMYLEMLNKQLALSWFRGEDALNEKIKQDKEAKYIG